MLHIGIDIAKRSHEVAILDEQGALCGKPFSIKNQREGVDYLLKRLGQVNSQGQSLHFGLEATGHYWLALYCALEDLGYHVTVLNPMQSAAYRKLQIRPVKTDRVDARCIAEVIRIRPGQASPYTNEKLYSLRQLTRLRNELIQQNSLNKRRALAVVDRVFPEFETLFSHVFGKTARAILVHYGTPQRIAALDLEVLTTFIRHYSGGKLGQAKAELVLQSAQNSFSARLGQDVAHLQLRLLIEQIEFVEQQLKALETEIETYMTEIPQTLTTIPGIAKGLAATLIAEIGDIRRFQNAKALVAYTGIDPRVFQSGQFTAPKTRISKRGSPYLRLAFWQAATITTRFDPALKSLLQRKMAEGKPYQVAIGAVANKLVHITYALLRDHKPYQPQLPMDKPEEQTESGTIVE